MDFPIWIVAIVAILCIPPVFLFRPLVIALANRINGKSVNTEEIKLLRTRVANLEDHLHEMRTRMILIEDTHEFSRKLEDSSSKKRS